MTTKSPVPPSTYRDGMEITIFSHNPAAAPNPKLKDTDEFELFEEGLKAETVTKYPRWGLHHIMPGQQRTLKIKKSIRCGYEAGTQVLLCSVTSSEEAIDVVAKVYDPLCYKVKIRRADWWDPEEEFVIPKNDRALDDYVSEATTYQHLQKTRIRDLTQEFVPEYHGSWIMEMPAAETKVCHTQPEEISRNRAVCSILMEYIVGTTLFQLTKNPKTHVSDRSLRDEQYPDQWLECATKQYLKHETRLLQAGVDHEDLGSHNIIVCPSPASAMAALQKAGSTKSTSMQSSQATHAQGSETGNQELIEGLPRPRIVILDFGQSRVMNVTTTAKNPMQRYWNCPDGAFTRLVPWWWFHDSFRQVWLKQNFGAQHAKEYAPVTLREQT